MRKETRLLRLRPSTSLRSSNVWYVFQVMVAVILTGFRVITGTTSDLSWYLEENEVISSITVGLVTGQEAATSLAHLYIVAR